MMEEVITGEVLKRREKKEVLIKRLLSYTILSAIGITMVLPFLWMLSTSFREPGNVFTYPPQWIPRPFIWKNYPNALNAIRIDTRLFGIIHISKGFLMFYLNSVFVAVCVTFGQVFTSSLAAYAFARLKFPGRDKLFLAYLATLMIPGAVTMIPVFILMRLMNWVDTYRALIIPSMFTAYGTFLLRQFFMGIPTDLEDAAKIDGCNLFGIYWRIILPLAKPALATLTTFTFIGSWNNFMWPLIMINSMEKKTLPIGLASFQGLYHTDWTLLMAGSMMVVLPVIIVFVFNQRFFVEGIRLGAVKG